MSATAITFCVEELFIRPSKTGSDSRITKMKIRKTVTMAESDTRKMSFSAIHSRGRARWPRCKPIQPMLRLVFLLWTDILDQRAGIGAASIEQKGRTDWNRKHPSAPGVWTMQVPRRNSRYWLLIAQLRWQGIIADVFHDLLTVIGPYPAQIIVNLALVERRVDIVIKVAPDGIAMIQHRLLAGFDRLRAGSFADAEHTGAGAIGGPAVTDAIGVL